MENYPLRDTGKGGREDLQPRTKRVPPATNTILNTPRLSFLKFLKFEISVGWRFKVVLL